MKMHERDEYRNSFYDGMCASVFGTLTGGVFLTGFALHIGMNEWMIGVLAAIPFMVTLFQLPGSYFICKRGGRKKIATYAAILARLMWLPILIAGLYYPNGTGGGMLLVLVFYFVSQAFSSVSYVAWLAWTSDLVPDEIRGTFFGTRNMLCGAAGIVTVLVFGNLVDLFNSHGGSSFVNAIPFACALLFGMISAYFLNRVPEISVPSACPANMWHELVKPFQETNFRNFLFFTLIWNFSVYLSAPFFALYFLRELNYSYGFVALLTTIGALVDILGMKFWGAVSDRVKNRAVIQVAGWGVVLLPSMWIMVRPDDVLLPIFIQILGGGFWAGLNLCLHNMNLRISPREGRVWFISAYSIIAGTGAAIAPLIAGVFLSLAPHPSSGPGGLTMLPLHYLFIASTLLRVVSLLIFRSVHEPKEVTARELLSLLGRGMRPALPSSATSNSVHP